MTSLALVLLRSYLGLFAFFAPNRDHVRREHSLVEGSLREAYQEYRTNHGRAAATLMAIGSHLGELWPHALIAKTRADCASVRPDRRYALRVASGAGGVAVLGVAAFLTLGVQLGSAGPVADVARVFPDGDPRAGHVEHVADVGSLQEGIYIATGGRVCIDPDLTAAELTDEIVNGNSTPEELEACAHYTLPE